MHLSDGIGPTYQPAQPIRPAHVMREGPSGATGTPNITATATRKTQLTIQSHRTKPTQHSQRDPRGGDHPRAGQRTPSLKHTF